MNKRTYLNSCRRDDKVIQRLEVLWLEIFLLLHLINLAQEPPDLKKNHDSFFIELDCTTVSVHIFSKAKVTSNNM